MEHNDDTGCESQVEDGLPEEVPLTADGNVPYWYTARLMADICPVDGDPGFWDRWKDEMKETR